LKRFVLEIAGGHRVDILTEERLCALVYRARDVQPAKFMYRRVDARGRGLFGVLRMVAGSFEPQLILNEVRILTLGLTLNGKARQIFDALVVGQIEGKERLGVAAIRGDRESAFLGNRAAHGISPAGYGFRVRNPLSDFN